MTLLNVERIGKWFGGLQALSEVTFGVNQDEIVGLMGANGAGKTTLFSIIGGHLKPDHGDIRFKGKSIAGFRPDRICRIGIARTFQIVRPFAGLTARENVETAVLFGSEKVAARNRVSSTADEVLEAVGLSSQAEKPAGTLTLSGRKRLEVARALATGPDLLLLDEVMAGLTPTEIAEMLQTIRSVKENHSLTIIIIDHVVGALVDLSDRIIVLHHGQMIAEGDPLQVANDAAVRAVYFGEDA